MKDIQTLLRFGWILPKLQRVETLRQAENLEKDVGGFKEEMVGVRKNIQITKECIRDSHDAVIRLANDQKTHGLLVRLN